MVALTFRCNAGHTVRKIVETDEAMDLLGIPCDFICVLTDIECHGWAHKERYEVIP
jgi:hypothetical protein